MDSFLEDYFRLDQVHGISLRLLQTLGVELGRLILHCHFSFELKQVVIRFGPLETMRPCALGCLLNVFLNLLQSFCLEHWRYLHWWWSLRATSVVVIMPLVLHASHIVRESRRWFRSLLLSTGLFLIEHGLDELLHNALLVPLDVLDSYFLLEVCILELVRL